MMHFSFQQEQCNYMEKKPAMIMAATADFSQARPPQWWQHPRRTATVIASTAFSFAKSRQDLSHSSLVSRGGPDNMSQRCFMTDYSF